MPQVITKPVGDVCSHCQHRFKWHQSKFGKCYWCETGKIERAVTFTPHVEASPASSKPSKAKRR